MRLDRITVQADRASQRGQAQQQQQSGTVQQERAYGEVDGYIAARSATASKTDTLLNETPQSITVVTSGQIKDQAAMTVQEAVRYVPGTYADAYGPDSRGDFPRVRGTDPSLFLDGMRVADSWRFNEYRPDPFTLSRIEVLRGPSSTLYGDTPTGGLVNLVSKRPQADEHREIGFVYGSYDYKQVQTDLTGKLTPDGEWLYRLIGIFRDADYQTDFVENDRLMFMPAITWRPSANTNWTVLGVYQKDKSGSSTAFLPLDGTLFPNPNGQIPINRFASEPGFDRYETETTSVSSLFEHTFSTTFKVRQNMRYMHIDGIYDTAYPNNYSDLIGLPFFPYLDASRRTVHRFVSQQRTKRDIFTSDTGGELNFVSGPITHKLLFGFDARTLTEDTVSGSDLDLRPFDLFAPVYGQPFQLATAPTLQLAEDPGVRQQQYGLYVQDQMRLGPWIVQAGLRRDRVIAESEGDPKQKDSATTKRIAVMHEFPFGLTPYVSYSESFTPIFGANVCATLCKPQEGAQYEAGFKWQVAPAAVFNAAWFDATEKNRLASHPTDPTISSQLGEVNIRGLELEYLGSITPDFDIIAAYSYIDARITQGDNVGARVEGIPTHQASLWGKYRFSWFNIPGFSIGAGVRYVGQSESENATTKIVTPDYTLFDAMFAWENEEWRFQVNATNLTDEIYFSTCLTRGDCFYGTRRTITSSLTYKF